MPSLARPPPPRTSADFIDPEVDEMFVLVHDAGTADAQYFSITVNRTECAAACRHTPRTALPAPPRLPLGVATGPPRAGRGH